LCLFVCSSRRFSRNEDECNPFAPHHDMRLDGCDRLVCWFSALSGFSRYSARSLGGFSCIALHEHRDSRWRPDARAILPDPHAPILQRSRASSLVVDFLRSVSRTQLRMDDGSFRSLARTFVFCARHCDHQQAHRDEQSTRSVLDDRSTFGWFWAYSTHEIRNPMP